MTPETDIAAVDHDLAERLRARGQRVTSQRLVINRLLRERNAHLTAEDVHEACTDRLPGTSLPTVYATLDLFADLGIVRRVYAGGGAVLYDSRTPDHHHMVCGGCGRVADLDAAVDLAAARAAAGRAGFAPERVNLIVEGLCADCARARQRR
ncbi:MAG TPA: Fur family transcriptional regulator [Gaiellales bacterium]|jgi:Fe2+ or Zn2+ uptake regulation protein|nr:Fur family transcriptional regulator [Gaiellales bacterium]